MIRKDTIIISAFPGTGKTYLYYNNEYDKNIGDLDSLTFSHTISENGTIIRQSEFPNNYIKYIENRIGIFDYMLISSHDVVREHLRNDNIKYFLVYPDKSLHDEYIRRYINRRNNKKYIKKMNMVFDSYIDSCENDEYGFKIKLESGQYLSDVIRKIELIYKNEGL